MDQDTLISYNLAKVKFCKDNAINTLHARYVVHEAEDIDNAVGFDTLEDVVSYLCLKTYHSIIERKNK